MNSVRLKNTIYNFITSIGGQIITILMQFAVRTVFIRTLGKAYLGLGGFFSNILSMLSLAELGVGSAIIYKLYESIANDDFKRIAALMSFYKKAYHFIGLAIAVLGICLIPFLPILIKDYDRLSALNINTVLVFCLYLADSVSSYFFFAYKTSLIKADQKEYLLNVVDYFFTFGISLVQIVILFLFRKFEIYVLMFVIKNIAENIYYSKLTDKLFPFIREKAEEELSKEESKEILKDCGAIFLYKTNNVVVKSTDNILLSAFIGLESVALYSNYYIFYKSITQLLAKIFNSVGHSLGNLHTEGNLEHEYEVFEATMLISAILGGTAFVGIAVVADEFIKKWIGNDWIIPQPFAILMGIELFTTAFKQLLSKYRTTMGLFQQAKYRPVAGIIINIIVSIALVKPLGIVGVLIGTLVSDWLTFMWYDPLIIHRFGFQNNVPVSRYYTKFIKYFIVSGIMYVVNMRICGHLFTGYGWISIVLHSLICGITTPAAIVLSTLRGNEMNYLLYLAKKEKNYGK